MSKGPTRREVEDIMHTPIQCPPLAFSSDARQLHMHVVHPPLYAQPRTFIFSSAYAQPSWSKTFSWASRN